MNAPCTPQHGRTVVVLNVRHIDLARGCTLEAYQKMGAFIIEKVAAMPQTQSMLLCQPISCPRQPTAWLKLLLILCVAFMIWTLL
jgi:hypothetical protein